MLSRSAVLVALGCVAGASALHAPSASGLAQRAPLDAGLRRVAPTTASAMNLRGGAPKAAVAAPKPWYDAFWNETTELGLLFGLWYWGNAYYNITNKKALKLVGGAKGGLVWTIALTQLLTGVVWVLPLWLLGLRKAPVMTAANWKAMAPIGLWSAGAHGGSVIALGAGAVSFGQILKACEPVFSAFTEVLLTGQVQAWQIYACLIPIIGGVGIASLKELSFSWLAVISAMIANQSAALKGVVNILSVLWTLPVCLALEMPNWQENWDKALRKGAKQDDVIKNSLLSGFAFYLYNEVSFLALAKVSPVTHSVANTLKRIVIIVVSTIVFGDKMTKEGMAGSAVAILGTLLYSLAKNKYGGGGH
ncbi:triose-phosphate transporter family-domain-containing protein [Baffinella frigidus]|nr:triose-phosphate transporter family-domain-containing protein [Cryptophyta sp. CCMP2293]